MACNYYFAGSIQFPLNSCSIFRMQDFIGSIYADDFAEARQRAHPTALAQKFAPQFRIMIVIAGDQPGLLRQIPQNFLSQFIFTLKSGIGYISGPDGVDDIQLGTAIYNIICQCGGFNKKTTFAVLFLYRNMRISDQCKFAKHISLRFRQSSKIQFFFATGITENKLNITCRLQIIKIKSAGTDGFSRLDDGVIKAVFNFNKTATIDLIRQHSTLPVKGNYISIRFFHISSSKTTRDSKNGFLKHNTPPRLPEPIFANLQIYYHNFLQMQIFILFFLFKKIRKLFFSVAGLKHLAIYFISYRKLNLS